MRAGGNQPGDMGHVDQQPGAARVRDRTHAGEVEFARVGGAAGDQQLGPQCGRLFRERVVVDHPAVRRDEVVVRVEPAS